MAQKFVCIRECHYGPRGYRKRFEIGEELPSNWRPGKHFVPAEAFGDALAGATAIVTPADDPRSTKKIIKDLKKKHKIELDPKSSRKEAFYAWVDAEAALEEKPVEEPETDVGDQTADPLGALKFGQLTEEDIDAFKAKELVQSLQIRYGVELTFAGKSKRELVDYGIEQEMVHVGARAP